MSSAVWLWEVGVPVPAGESLVEGDGEADEQAVGKELRTRTRDALKTCPGPLFPHSRKREHQVLSCSELSLNR